jgi:hypothetical protein
MPWERTDYRPEEKTVRQFGHGVDPAAALRF